MREFLDLAASFAGVNWKSCVETDTRYFRPTEVDFLQGDASKARQDARVAARNQFRRTGALHGRT